MIVQLNGERVKKFNDQQHCHNNMARLDGVGNSM